MTGRVLATLAAAFVLGAHGAEPVAFVADVRGNATIEGNGPVVFLAELAPGTRLLLGTGAFLAVTFATGAEYTFAGPGEFLVTPGEVRVEKGATPARRNVTALPDLSVVARVSHTATASLRMRSLSPPNSSARGGLEYPVATRIATLQPMLRWKNAESSAIVSVADASGKEVWKGEARSASPAPSLKLAPATVYKWTVMTPQGSIGEASFETLPAATLTRVAKSRAAAKTFADRVVHALLLQDIGATQEAREAWAGLARERPDLPGIGALAQ
jgi:hypothetical protein